MSQRERAGEGENVGLQKYSAEVEGLVARGKRGDVRLVKEDGDRLLADLKRAMKNADRAERAQLDRLQRTITVRRAVALGGREDVGRVSGRSS